VADGQDDSTQEEQAAGTVFTRDRFGREGDGLEFDRVANFADAIYAIALTLVVVGIGVPGDLDDESSSRELLESLGELLPDIITFFVVFFVVGNYWLAHHRFMSWLDQADTTLIRLQLVYLSVIAFLPFPAALLGSLDDNAVALASFALAMACASGLETVLLTHANRAGLMKQPLSDAAARWERNASLSPVGVFLLSIPLGFISVWLGIAFWAVNIPVGMLLNRRRPAEFAPPRQRRR
jgi:uncharacterized membrane protein